MAEVFALDSDWKQVKIGAGGWVTGIDIHSDGTMVTRTDTAGAYIWDGAMWQPLVTAYSMPAETGNTTGVYEIRIAPSDSNILYMETNGGIYKSIDQGAHWIKTTFPTVSMNANSANRMDGQKMAIDPNNPNVVFAGTQKDGLWVTRDGGASWQKIAAVPQGTNGGDTGLTGIVIHNSTIYVGTAGSGVYRSDDAGLTWQRVPGGPTDVSHAAISPSGELYVTGNTDTALWKLVDGAWTKLIASEVHAIAIDPFDPTHLVAVRDSGNIQESSDGGASWTGWNWKPQLESTNDVAWLENSSTYMSSGGVVFDPITPNKLYQSAGVGVWNTIIPDVLSWSTPVIWNSQSAGIENLVPNDIIAPVGGNPVFASWDRAFFEVEDLDSYETSYSGGGFSMGWSIDYASTDPSFIIGISDYWGRENSGYSTDGGQTWQKFEGLPSFALTTIGGSIAASTPTNFIWASANNVAPAYTLDGGKTWTDVTIPGLTDWSGFHYAYYLKRTTITADRVDDNTFYLYDAKTGVYVTKDGGVSWTKVFDGQVSPWSYWNAKIEAVPGSEGELFFTSGHVDGEPANLTGVLLMHSTDGGATWQAIAGVKASTFGYGAAKVEGGPATIFIAGSVNGVDGIFYSTDNAQSWTQIGRYPMGNLDTITTISGDMDDFGLVYVGLGGSGYVYLDVDATTEPQPQPLPEPPPPPPADAVNDFNGDGRSDILWRNDDGKLSIWLGQANGGFTPSNIEAASLVPTAERIEAASLVPTAGRVVGTADFNGDGRTDMLWRNTDGTLSNWLGQVNGGFTRSDAVARAEIPSAWQVAGTGDFNGDGRDDVLWRNDDGQISNWLGLANGGFTPNNANAASTVSTAWSVAGIGDFNGDGRDDILWRNVDGQLSNWLGTANGGFTPNNQNAATLVTTAWQVAGTGDFNGDGRDDILWRSADGQLSNWLGQANGGFVANDANAAMLVPTAWTVVATGDYNGDGRDDILWRHTDGTLSNWLGQADGGFVANDANAATAVAINWNVQPADMWI